jgi:MoaA/NifB/PqqE/SkfB family radical SAM enzyme
MEELNNLMGDRNKVLVIGGILHSSRAFVGPEVLHIDLTNRCNFNCMACWCRSPLLGEKAMPEWEKKLTLPLKLIKGVFDDVARMGGLRQVKLVGGGEPFMHPDILEIVEYIKKKNRNIEIDINTNFSLVDEKCVKRVFDLEVDSFTVSMWAGTAEAYTAVHPNQTAKTFHKIKEMLNLIAEEKKRLNRTSPRIVIHDVIFNVNYKDVGEMLKFGLETGADAIQFVPMDPIKEKTDTLLLNGRERKELIDMVLDIKKSYDAKSLKYVSVDGRSITLPDFEGFINRLQRLDIQSGAYDETAVKEMPCYVGWLFARIMTTGNVVPCCKGHRMILGNIHKNRFKDIWLSRDYNEFRYKCLNLPKTDGYFSRIGNDAVAKTGCYNCDNLWQNIPMHNKIAALKKYNFDVFCGSLLKNLFNDDRKDSK